LIYYLNKWSPGAKGKGFYEFDRTFGYWFDFKNKFQDKIDQFTDSSQYLMKLLRINNLFMKNLNNYMDIKSILNKYDSEENNLDIINNDPINVNDTTFPELNKDYYKKNLSYYIFINKDKKS